MGFLTVMIDLDPQCDLSKMYQQDPADGPTIFELLRGECSMENACLLVSENLYLVRGSRDTIHFQSKNGEHTLACCLQDSAMAEVDFVIIDHPPTLSESALAGYVASDAVLIVTDTESFSLANLTYLVENLLNIQQTMNPALSIVGIVANKVDLRRNLTKTMLHELTSGFGDYVLASWVSYDTAIPTAIRRGQTLRQLPWQSRTVQQFKSRTSEVLERMAN